MAAAEDHIKSAIQLLLRGQAVVVVVVVAVHMLLAVAVVHMLQAAGHMLLLQAGRMPADHSPVVGKRRMLLVAAHSLVVGNRDRLVALHILVVGRRHMLAAGRILLRILEAAQLVLELHSLGGRLRSGCLESDPLQR